MTDKKSLEDYTQKIKSAAKTGAGAATATAASLLGADLVVVALAWDNPPSAGGIITITFLMLMSFMIFISVLHQLMRSEYLFSRLRNEKTEEDQREQDNLELMRILKWVRALHLSGLIFTMLAFWIISYKYLISIEGYNGVILILPFILFFLYWIPKIIRVEREVSILKLESLVQFCIQIIFLILICLDFLRVITIP
ncbi:MAG: hypothetical protein ACW99E_21930 [Promethearchaeota archaeon]|jgi:hypothetical protein